MFKLTNFKTAILRLDIRHQGAQPCHYPSRLWGVEEHHCPHLGGLGVVCPPQNKKVIIDIIVYNLRSLAASVILSLER